MLRRRLLEKAGWRQGTGLGANKQGRQMPLEQSQQKGRQGLGAQEAAAAAAAAAKRQQQQQQQRARQEPPVRVVVVALSHTWHAPLHAA